MCGLSAVLEFAPAEASLSRLLAMHAQIPHRGPDGEGFLMLDGQWRPTLARNLDALRRSAPPSLRAALAFRWLKILDPGEAAAQPMGSADGLVWLMFNGEIYNFRELRGSLQQLGHAFRTETDTEVILAAYDRWGCDCFRRFNGMWAMVVLDLRRRTLVISRDRFGIKPLFYAVGPERLMFASEVKQLLAAGVKPTANGDALRRFIAGARPATPEQTFFEGVFAMPAATFAEIRLDTAFPTLDFEPYWILTPTTHSRSGYSGSIEDAVSSLDGLLQRSVSEHMTAQVLRGNLVSGGLDSSLLAALAGPSYAEKGETGLAASMVISASPPHDESAYIDCVVAALRFRSFRSELTAAWLMENIARITRTQEEPVAGMAVAGQFLSYETAANNGIRVVLDGQGADEIFGGYPRHQYALFGDLMRRHDLRSLLRQMAPLAVHDPKVFRDLWRRIVWPRLMRSARLAGSPRRLDFVRTAAGEPAAREQDPAARHVSRLAAELRRDVLTGNLRPALAVTDRNAMAHSIEARVPYVDQRVIEFAFGLPDCFKIGGGWRKRILRAVAARHVPKRIVARTDRIGFGAPVARWLRGELRGEISQLANARALSDTAAIDAGKLRTYVDDFLAGRHDDAGAVWRTYAVERWATAYAVTGL